jgi:predicted dehydrogenase
LPPPSRRSFLRTSALATLALPWWSACRTPRRRTVAASEKLQHACIGVGGMGAVDLRNFLSHPRVAITALCDVDTKALEAAARLAPGARCYRDWRELLAAEGDRLDSLNVTVPDHMHFPVAWTALRAGKHVYCQKPLCHDVAEVRELTRAAARSGCVTQLGTQHASDAHDRVAVQWLREGRIGRIQHVYLNANRVGAEKYRLAGPRPAPAAAPAHLDWDLWLGTAPERPYAPGVYHPGLWRSWQDFGTGWSGDIGCHLFDAVWRSLELRAPLSVVAEVQESWRQSPARRAETWPQSNHLTWTFPGNARTAGRTLTVEWFDGEFFPPESVRRLYSDDLADYPQEAAMLIGTEGALLLPHRFAPHLLPEERFAGVTAPALPPRNHYHHFVDACLGGPMTESHFGQTGPMTEAILLGTVAIRHPGMRLEWDAARMRVTNLAAANATLRRTYRAGWSRAGF